MTSMNLLLLRSDDFLDPQHVRLCGQRLDHINEILGSQANDALRVGLINGLCGTARLLSINSTEATLHVTLDTPPPAPLPLTVVLALPRPKMLRRILKNTAEFGIKQLHLINSYKVEKSYWQTPALKPETCKAYFEEGLIQAKDTVMPELHLHKRFKPFVEDHLPTIIDGQQAFVAHPYNAEPMPSPSTEKRVIVIGPEGGFTDYEIDLLQQQGVKTISMGQRIYRVENALTRLTCQLSATPHG